MVNPKIKYWAYDSVISDKDCNRIIEFGESIIEKEKTLGNNTSATTWDATAKQDYESSNTSAKSQGNKALEDIPESEKTYIRDSEVCFFNESWCYDLIMPYVHDANKNAKWFYHIDRAEDIQFTKYNKDGFYGWHTDGDGDYHSTYVYDKNVDTSYAMVDERMHVNFPEWDNRCRKLSVTVNLNGSEFYEGGILNFDFGPHLPKEHRFVECTDIKPQGSLVVFPSYIPHQVTPVKSGTRYSLVMWLLGTPFR